MMISITATRHCNRRGSRFKLCEHGKLIGHFEGNNSQERVPS